MISTPGSFRKGCSSTSPARISKTFTFAPEEFLPNSLRLKRRRITLWSSQLTFHWSFILSRLSGNDAMKSFWPSWQCHFNIQSIITNSRIFLNGIFQAYFFFNLVFSIQWTLNKCSFYQFGLGWIQTADLWCKKRLLFQLSHNHYPNH